MATVVSTINLKGGVGKTQLTVGLGEVLAADLGYKVLIIDLDPQTNATVMLIGDKKWEELNKSGQTLYYLFKDKIDNTCNFSIEESIISPVSNVNGGLFNLHLLPSSLDLINIQDRIPSIDQFGLVASSTILQQSIQSYLDKYDFVLIDCPPNLGIITLNGICISDYYLIPTKADRISTYGIPQILNRINDFNKVLNEVLNKNVEPLGIVITMYSGHQKRLHDQVIRELEHKHRTENYPKVFNAYIPLRQKIAETAYYEDTSYTLRQKYADAYDSLRKIAKQLIEEVPS
jgi:chromosome partitioning protein